MSDGNDTNMGEGAYRDTPDEKEIYRLEKLLRETVDERDEAQQALSRIYYIVFCRAAEWSNNFGVESSVEEISDAVNALKQHNIGVNKLLDETRKIRDEWLAEYVKARDTLREICDITDPYADGAPDATDHDKLCNEIASLSREY